MYLLRTLFMICSINSFHVSAAHVPGITNAIADSLPRSQFQEFHRLAPMAQPTPDKVPPFPWEDDCLTTFADMPALQFLTNRD